MILPSEEGKNDEKTFRLWPGRLFCCRKIVVATRLQASNYLFLQTFVLCEREKIEHVQFDLLSHLIVRIEEALNAKHSLLY